MPRTEKDKKEKKEKPSKISKLFTRSKSSESQGKPCDEETNIGNNISDSITEINKNPSNSVSAENKRKTPRPKTVQRTEGILDLTPHLKKTSSHATAVSHFSEEEGSSSTMNKKKESIIFSTPPENHYHLQILGDKKVNQDNYRSIDVHDRFNAAEHHSLGNRYIYSDSQLHALVKSEKSAVTGKLSQDRANLILNLINQIIIPKLQDKELRVPAIMLEKRNGLAVDEASKDYKVCDKILTYLRSWDTTIHFSQNGFLFFVNQLDGILSGNEITAEQHENFITNPTVPSKESPFVEECKHDPRFELALQEIERYKNEINTHEAQLIDNTFLAPLVQKKITLLLKDYIKVADLSDYISRKTNNNTTIHKNAANFKKIPEILKIPFMFKDFESYNERLKYILVATFRVLANAFLTILSKDIEFAVSAYTEIENTLSARQNVVNTNITEENKTENLLDYETTLSELTNRIAHYNALPSIILDDFISITNSVDFNKEEIYLSCDFVNLFIDFLSLKENQHSHQISAFILMCVSNKLEQLAEMPNESRPIKIYHLQLFQEAIQNISGNFQKKQKTGIVQKLARIGSGSIAEMPATAKQKKRTPRKSLSDPFGSPRKEDSQILKNEDEARIAQETVSGESSTSSGRGQSDPTNNQLPTDIRPGEFNPKVTYMPLSARGPKKNKQPSNKKKQTSDGLNLDNLHSPVMKLTGEKNALPAILNSEEDYSSLNNPIDLNIPLSTNSNTGFSQESSLFDDPLSLSAPSSSSVEKATTSAPTVKRVASLNFKDVERCDGPSNSGRQLTSYSDTHPSVLMAVNAQTGSTDNLSSPILFFPSSSPEDSPGVSPEVSPKRATDDGILKLNLGINASESKPARKSIDYLMLSPRAEKKVATDQSAASVNPGATAGFFSGNSHSNVADTSEGSTLVRRRGSTPSLSNQAAGSPKSPRVTPSVTPRLPPPAPELVSMIDKSGKVNQQQARERGKSLVHEAQQLVLEHGSGPFHSPRGKGKAKQEELTSQVDRKDTSTLASPRKGNP